MAGDPSFTDWLDAQLAKLREAAEDGRQRLSLYAEKLRHNRREASGRYVSTSSDQPLLYTSSDQPLLYRWTDNRAALSDDELLDLGISADEGDSEEEMELNRAPAHQGAPPAGDRDFYKVVWDKGDTVREPREASARERVAQILKETDAGDSDSSRAAALASVSAESGFVDTINAQYGADSAPMRDMEADLDWQMETASVDGAESLPETPPARIRGLPARPQRSPPPEKQDERPMDDEEIQMFMEEMERFTKIYEPGKGSKKTPIFQGKGAAYRKMDSTIQPETDDEPVDLSMREPMERDTMPIVDQESLRVRAHKHRRKLKISLVVAAVVLLTLAFCLTTYFIVKALGR